ncbi:hypothetical protein ABZX98_00715 [Streptomyces sp. NPDC002992]|uniref:hypothetical protein n=1 Tax=Streptomyces sp. NPDC002992 TaxID=3154273 RepID=UPI0033BBDA9D
MPCRQYALGLEALVVAELPHDSTRLLIHDVHSPCFVLPGGYPRAAYGRRGIPPPTGSDQRGMKPGYPPVAGR